MTEDEIVDFVTGLSDVDLLRPRAGSDAPEIAWGDTFVYYQPAGSTPEPNRMPFATIVTKDYPGYDTASELDRAGVFRVNIAVGRARFTEELGYSPAAHAARAEGIDYAEADRVLPHPLYAEQSWVCVVDPGERTGERVRELLRLAHERAVARAR